MIHAMLEVSAFRCDEARCSRCGGLLTRTAFVTDWLGRSVERCPACGPRLVQLHVGAPVAKHASVFKSQVIGKCADCPTKITWRGTGTKPARCTKCQRKRGQIRDLAAYHERQKRLSKLLAC